MSVTKRCAIERCEYLARKGGVCLAHSPERVAQSERMAANVAKVVADAPPLTPAQRDRIYLLLHGSAA